MHSLKAFLKACFFSWLAASIAIAAIFISGSRFWSAGIPATLFILSLWTAFAMFPGFILLAIARTVFPPASHFWDLWICSITGFILGIIVVLIWWDMLTRRLTLPSTFEASTWALASTAAGSGMLAFLLFGIFLRRKKTEQGAAANP
jgi:hypothetical protein